MFEKKFLLIIFILFLSSCSAKDHEFICLDCGFATYWQVRSEDDLTAYSGEIKKEIKNLSELFDIHINNNRGLSLINNSAAGKAVELDEITLLLLEDAFKYTSLTNGNFDISQGDLLNYWQSFRDNYKNGDTLPDYNILKKYYNQDSINAFEIKDNIIYKNKNVRIDAGGFAKGFALQYIAEKLENDGHKVLLNAGGNIINKIGGSRKIALQDPRSDHSFLEFELADQYAVATSGDYQNYILYENKYIHHIINFKSLYPADYYYSVTVICKDAGLADMLSTALFTLDLQEGEKLLNNFDDVGVCYIFDQEKEYPKDIIKDNEACYMNEEFKKNLK